MRDFSADFSCLSAVRRCSVHMNSTSAFCDQWYLTNSLFLSFILSISLCSSYSFSHCISNLLSVSFFSKFISGAWRTCRKIYILYFTCSCSKINETVTMGEVWSVIFGGLVGSWLHLCLIAAAADLSIVMTYLFLLSGQSWSMWHHWALMSCVRREIKV